MNLPAELPRGRAGGRTLGPNENGVGRIGKSLPRPPDRSPTVTQPPLSAAALPPKGGGSPSTHNAVTVDAVLLTDNVIMDTQTHPILCTTIPPQPPSKLVLSFGLKASDNRPDNRELAWDEFMAKLSKPPRAAEIDVADFLADKQKHAGFKDGPYFTGCAFDASRAEPGGGWRTANLAGESSVWVGDFDAGRLTEEEIRGRLTEWRHIGYTTFSNSEDHPKFRVVVPLAGTANDAEYAAIDAMFRGMFAVNRKDALDPKGKNRVQIWYLPAHPRDAGGLFSFWHEDGALLDPDCIPLEYPETPVVQRGLTDPDAAAVIAALNNSCSIGDALKSFGYNEITNRRFLAPGSTSGAPGVSVFDNGLCYSHHSPTSDPLADGKPHDVFDVYRICEMGGDWAKALRGARADLGIPPAGVQKQRASAFEFPLERGRLNCRFTQLPPPRDFVVENFLLAGKPGVLAGLGGTSKTQFALEIGVGVALGMPVLGMAVDQPGAAMLVLGEEDEGEVDRRVGAIAAALQLNEDQCSVVSKRMIVWPAAGEDVRLTVESYEGVKATGAADTLIERAKSLEAECGLPLRLIVLDHYMLCAGGDANANEDATQFTREVANIARATGAAVLTIAHSPKAAAKNEIQDQSAVRGASAIVDNSRMVALLVPMTEKDALCYGVSKDRRNEYARLEIVKNNYGKTQAICWVQRIYAPDHQTVTLRRVALAEIPKPLRGKNSTVGDPHQKIIDIVGQAPGKYSVRGFTDKHGGRDGDFGIGKNTFEAEVRELIAAGRLIVRAPTAEECTQYGHSSNIRSVLDVKLDSAPDALILSAEIIQDGAEQPAAAEPAAPIGNLSPRKTRRRAARLRAKP